MNSFLSGASKPLSWKTGNSSIFVHSSFVDVVTIFDRPLLHCRITCTKDYIPISPNEPKRIDTRQVMFILWPDNRDCHKNRTLPYNQINCMARVGPPPFSLKTQCQIKKIFFSNHITTICLKVVLPNIRLTNETTLN